MIYTVGDIMWLFTIAVTDLEEDRYRDLKNNTSLKHLILDENPLGVDLVHKYVYLKWQVILVAHGS